MTKILNTSITLFLCATISGCGGGGGGNSSGGTSRSYSDQEALTTQLNAEIVSLSSADPSSLPTMGSVNYNGTLAIAVNPAASGPRTFLGDLSLTADFQNSAVTGGLSNINDSTGASYKNSIPLTNGGINRSAGVGQTVTGELVGDVVDASNNTVSFDTNLSGDFLGTDEGYIAGDVTGSLTIDGAATTIAPDNGAFVVSDGS